MPTAAQKATLQSLCNQMRHVAPSTLADQLFSLSAQLQIAAAPFGQGALALALRVQSAVGQYRHDCTTYGFGFLQSGPALSDALNALLANVGLQSVPAMTPWGGP